HSTVPSYLFSSFLSCSAPHRDLHSFPTRRSSDLRRGEVERQAGAAAIGEVMDGLHDDEVEYAVRVVASVAAHDVEGVAVDAGGRDRKSTRLNSSHVSISYAVFCLKKKKKK